MRTESQKLLLEANQLQQSDTQCTLPDGQGGEYKWADDPWGPPAGSPALWAGVCRSRPDPAQNTKINSVVQLSLPVSVRLGGAVALPSRPCAVAVQSSHSVGSGSLWG